MKNRNGFVSNSSSASFVCRWVMYNDMSLEDSIDEILMDYGSDELKKIKDNLIHSTHSDNGHFITRSFTSMLNDIDNVPLEFKNLITGLSFLSESKGKIIAVEINED
jgi:hypothetical protein